MNATLNDFDSLFREALGIASEASRRSNEAQENVAIVDDVILQIQVWS